jgi:hypothetical protein
MTQCPYVGVHVLTCRLGFYWTEKAKGTSSSLLPGRPVSKEHENRWPCISPSPSDQQQAKTRTPPRHHRVITCLIGRLSKRLGAHRTPRKTSTLDLPSSCSRISVVRQRLFASGLGEAGHCVGRLGRRVRHNPRSLACTNVAGWRHGLVFFKTNRRGEKELLRLSTREYNYDIHTG